MSHRSNICRSLFLITILLAAMQMSPGIMAQDEVAPARKLDAFEGPLGGCDYGARMDNFAIELQNNPSANGYIIYYGPKVEESGSGVLIGDISEDYLENVRGFDASRIKSIYGGRYQELDRTFTELWVIPQGAALPDPVSYENNVKTFSGMFAEYVYWEGTIDGEGIPQGNVMLAGFTDILQQQPESRAYIVVWNSTSGSPGAWRRAANEVSASLQNDYKVPADRINIICAGYDGEKSSEADNAKVQLWISPRDSPPPVSEVKGPEPTPEKAIEWRSFSDNQLVDAVDKRRVFEGFADVLRNDKKLNVFIIVRRVSAPKQDAADDTGAIKQFTDSVKDTGLEPDPESTRPDVDLMKLVGEWQSDLSKDYGISEHRMTIMPAEADEWNDGTLEIWIVPTGATPPDPFAENVVEEGVIDETGDMDTAQQQTPEAEPPN